MNCNKEAKSLTFGRGSEVSRDCQGLGGLGVLGGLGSLGGLRGLGGLRVQEFRGLGLASHAGAWISSTTAHR